MQDRIALLAAGHQAAGGTPSATPGAHHHLRSRRGSPTTTRPASAGAPPTEIKDADYALTPGRYLGAVEIEDDGEPLDAKIERLTSELLAAFDESRLEQVVRQQLERLV